MLKTAYSLGVRQALIDAGLTKESKMIPMWLKRTLMGTGTGAGLGAGTMALMGGDLSDIGVGAGLGALGGGLTGAAISGVKRLKVLAARDRLRAMMADIEKAFEGIS